MNSVSFAELNLSAEILKAIAEMGFEEATPIQTQAIPPIMEGKDVIGQAQTGTGKTVAFGIPAIEKVDPDSRDIQILVLCPTRELAIQSAAELDEVGRHKRGFRVLPIYGGQPIERQLFALKKHPQIVIGTPGRVMDHMRRKTLKLQHLTMIVLDEADEMLNMGFREDIDTILQEVPDERQTLLFSATMPPEILQLTRLYQKDPVHIKAVHKAMTVPGIAQFYLEVRESSKLDVLARLIDAKNIRLALVFCNTKKRVDELAAGLEARGYMVGALHGDMNQGQRDRVMAKFRSGAVEVLIATDVAARGLDVENVEAVINYDIPKDEEYYVHRIGRTGRAGKSGTAYTFVSGRQIYRLKEIERYTKSPIHLQKPPTLMDVEETKVSKTLDGLRATLSEGPLTKYVAYIEKLLEDESGTGDPENEITTLDIAAAFLKMSVEKGGEIKTEEPPPLEPNRVDHRGGREGMIRLFMNAGRMDNLSPRDVVAKITSRTSLPGRLVGAIDIHDRFMFVEVPSEYANEVMTVLKGQSLNGRRLHIARADARFNQGRTFPKGKHFGR